LGVLVPENICHDESTIKTLKLCTQNYGFSCIVKKFVEFR